MEISNFKSFFRNVTAILRLKEFSRMNILESKERSCIKHENESSINVWTK